MALRYNPAMLTDRLFARSARPSGAPAESQPSRWHHGPWWSNSYLLTPLLSILVFLVVMSLILWSLNRREQQQQEDTLYRNVAWAQQQIRLSMTGAQEQLQALSRATSRLGRVDQHGFQIRPSADVMQAHPEILYLNWYVAPGAAALAGPCRSAAARPAPRQAERRADWPRSCAAPGRTPGKRAGRPIRG